jgi:hypothetical protein
MMDSKVRTDNEDVTVWNIRTMKEFGLGRGGGSFKHILDGSAEL